MAGLTVQITGRVCDDNNCKMIVKKILPVLLDCTVLLLSVHPPAQSQQRLPNIIFILADDMGYGDVSGLNKDAKINTPNIDRLMQGGMHFTDAHTASAVCTPSRYALLTGRYAWRGALKNSVLWEYDPPLIEADRLTLGDMLKQKGYATACIGKWHLGWDWRLQNGAYWRDSAGPREGPGSRVRGSLSGLVDFTAPIENGPVTRGFDYYFGVDVPNFPPYCYFENDHLTRQPDTVKPDGMFGVKGAMAKGWSLEAVMPELTARAVKYIQEKAGSAKGASAASALHTGQGTRTNQAKYTAQDTRTAQRENPVKTTQPFFLYFPLTAPHTPIAPTAEFRGKSQAGLYGDFVEQVDWTVGEIMRAVRENGLWENTIIVFSSDNGSPARDGANMSGDIGSVRRFGHFPSYIFRGIKADIYEGGHRVPFIVSWPGRVKAGTVNDQTVCLVDWMATCADVINTRLPQDAGEDSYSLLPLLLQSDPAKYARPYTIHHSIAGYFAIRKGNWKLIMGAGSGGWSAPRPGKEEEGLPPIQLYNLSTDAQEQHNAADERPDLVNQLRAQLEKCIRDGRTVPYSDRAGRRK